MDENRHSKIAVFIISTVLAILFFYAYKNSLAHRTDFWLELLYLFGQIIQVVLMVLGTLTSGFLIWVVSKSPARSIRTFFVLMNENASWCDEVDASKGKWEKESQEQKYVTREIKSDIKTLFSNGNFFYKNIKEVREYVGIDAQAAQADAEKAIEASVKQ